MSDLHPISRDQLVDPTVTRLLVQRPGSAPSTRMLGGGRGVATSMSVLLLDAAPQSQAVIDSLRAWRPEGLRIELVVVAEESGPERLRARDAIAGTCASWRMVGRPLGGRATGLAAAVEEAENEFVLVSSGGEPPLELVAESLAHMWLEGADAALLGPSGQHEAAGRGEPTAAALDASSELARWLGLSGAVVPGRLVVMRRWVARWLFNEISRAIDPAEEVADRARLLGIGVVLLDEETIDR